MKLAKQRKISIFNMKGGLGKSTIAAYLAHAFALLGYPTLLIECDMQKNASSILPEPPTHTLTDVLTERVPLKQAIYQARDNFFIVPADRKLNTAANHIVSQGRKAYKLLTKSTQELTEYDFILYDHSPSYSAVTETALLASEELLIPCELEPYSVEGLIEMFNKLQEDLDDHELDIAGIIPTHVDLRYAMTHQYLQQLKDTFKDKITPIIRTDADVPKAQSFKQTIFEHNPHSKAAQDIKELAVYLIGGNTNA